MTLSHLDWLAALRETIADLLFPPSCAACGRYGAWLCPKCTSEIDTIRPPVCPACGTPISEWLSPHPAAVVQSDGLLCRGCRNGGLQLDGLRACGPLKGHLQTAIHRFKYEQMTCLARPLGDLMGQAWAALAPLNLQLDVIVPVPLHRARLRDRGYNQSALLAHALSAYLKNPVVEGVLMRRRATVPQVGLDATERRDNVSGAFGCDGERLDGLRVLLVDDVFTTGSTLEAACEALRQGGALTVWAYTLARAC